MGCRGSWGYLYRGQHYIIYDHHCEPVWLGKRLVSAVPTEPDEFKVWLAETKLFLEQVKDTVDEDSTYPDVPDVLSRSSYAPSISLNSEDYEYSYLYDLDNMVFCMSERVYFPLDNLPPYEEWITYIGEDGAENPCILPSTPEFYQTLVDDRLSPIRDLCSWEEWNLKLYKGVASDIDPSVWCNAVVPHSLSVARKLAKVVFTGFITARYSAVSTITTNFDNFVFEDLAMELLTAAAPANSKFTSNSNVADEWVHQHRVKNGPEYAIVRKYNRIPDPLWRMRNNAFWFRGRLVVLARTLVREDHLKSKIGFVIRRAKKKKLEECTAILWSVHHVAVVIVSGEKVSHSRVIPVVAAFGKEGADCKRDFDQGLELLMHYLSPIAANGGALLGSRLSMDIFVRIMDFTNERTSAALGRTSKALRVEWLKHPWIGPFVITGPSQDDDELLAQLGKTGQAIKLTMRPFDCLSHLDTDAIRKRRFEAAYVVYRMPFKFFDETLHRSTHWDKEVPDFLRIHGYEVRVKKKTAAGKFVNVRPSVLYRM
ncbi:hypothetical protein SCHPADRAFT_944251 [Schizopora paradoxa]|uniref:Uncharacterized protein n=1 Tax=Schizopora paradoxa TaxID=27342 RepID=A0A0H2RV63_9AGAM|nr:hypothetical protein SCHPADRAFT_944251 [Schizopora paradoxa]